jgi:Cu(I)/Ag(I) efflux system membrane fusion protein
MTNGTRITLALLLSAAALGAGYLLGRGSVDHAGMTPGPAAGAAASAGAEGAPAAGGRKLLYYRNPMGLPDTSPVPKKDPMGMDYIAVYEGEDDSSGAIKVRADRIQALGVRTEPVVRRALGREVRAVGTIEVDERGQFTVAPKFEGWIEKLHVNTTGQAVARGQPLAEVYSPELVSAQREYLIAWRATTALGNAGSEAQQGVRQLAEAALERLRNWDISEQQIARLREGGEPRRTLTLVAPASGVIVKEPPVAGMRFMPGEALFRIANLSTVWLIGDVFEQDLAAVRRGARATLRVDAYPDRSFPGQVTFIYPTLNAETRTARVRIELANGDGLLKPGMYGTVQIGSGPARETLVVPESAVIDSGSRQTVLVALGEGRFEPREVKLGVRAGGVVEVLSGVTDGESVVTRANFLIDAESNLKAALGGMNADANASGAGHRAVGTVDAIDARTGALTITHDPVPSLKWPKMTMDFVPANDAIAKTARPGAAIDFEFVERKPGEWVVTKIEPARGTVTKPAPAPAAAPAGAHKH